MNSVTMKTTTKKRLLASLLVCLLALAGCGGAQGTPTPIPAGVAHPVQSTPAYGGAARFVAATPAAPVQSPAMTPTGPAIAQPALPPTPDPRTAYRALLEQPPSALGIVTGGAALLAAPGGAALANLPAGEVVTLTGSSADGRYLAVYTNAFISGWVARGQLAVYGAADLAVVEQAAEPAPLATLIAEVMAPVQVLDALMATPEE